MAKKETKKPEKVKKKGKNKKGEAAQAAAGAPAGAPVGPNGQPSIPLSAMSPDQMTAQQLEQAIKESNDPEAKLKKLRSPLSVKSCLLNILFLIILTLGIVILWCFIAVDKFNFGTVVSDMSYQFGITQGFEWLWGKITGWFS